MVLRPRRRHRRGVSFRPARGGRSRAAKGSSTRVTMRAAWCTRNPTACRDSWSTAMATRPSCSCSRPAPSAGGISGLRRSRARPGFARSTSGPTPRCAPSRASRPARGPCSASRAPRSRWSRPAIRYEVDIAHGQKTGFFLDQRDNRALAGSLAAGRDVLNAFCYTGGFSLAALAAGARHVLSVDTSAEALAAARRNVEANGLDAARAEWLAADVFELLRKLRDQGRKFGLIVLDPPKFAPTEKHVPRAARAYKDINLWAMKLLAPGGRLLTFSCSGAIGPGSLPEDRGGGCGRRARRPRDRAPPLRERRPPGLDPLSGRRVPQGAAASFLSAGRLPRGGARLGWSDASPPFRPAERSRDGLPRPGRARRRARSFPLRASRPPSRARSMPLEWAIVALFALEYAVQLALAPDRARLPARSVARPGCRHRRWVRWLLSFPRCPTRRARMPALRILRLFRVLLFGMRAGPWRRQPRGAVLAPACPRARRGWRGWPATATAVPARRSGRTCCAGPPRPRASGSMRRTCRRSAFARRREAAGRAARDGGGGTQRVELSAARDGAEMVRVHACRCRRSPTSCARPGADARSPRTTCCPSRSIRWSSRSPRSPFDALPWGPRCALDVVRRVLGRNEELAGRLEREVRELETLPADESPERFFEATFRLKRSLSVAKGDLWRLRGLLEMLAEGRRTLPGLGKDGREAARAPGRGGGLPLRDRRQCPRVGAVDHRPAHQRRRARHQPLHAAGRDREHAGAHSRRSRAGSWA